MGQIFCVEYQSAPLKFHTNFLTHTLKDTIFIQWQKFKSSQIEGLICVVWKWLPDLELMVNKPYLALLISKYGVSIINVFMKTDCVDNKIWTQTMRGGWGLF